MEMLRETEEKTVSLAGHLECIEESCARKYDLERREYRCDACGGLLDLRYIVPPQQNARVLRDLWHQRKSSTDVRNQSGVWRFRELLPFVPEGYDVITLAEGRTPLLEVPRAGEWAGGVQVSIKHQGNNPTGSFKDLGMTACVTEASILGSRVVACASTGNTSASMAAYAVRAGMKALVFIPGGKISSAKLAQAMEFGAIVIEIGENFDESLGILRSLTEELNLYLVNSLNPFRLEGQKTIVCEILEQRGWRVPDYISVPGGNLGNVSAIGKGLAELKAAGLIDKLPRIILTQAEGANPFYRMLASGAKELIPVREPKTEATAIRIGNPVNWKRALHAMQLTNGICESVTDEEIFEAKAALAKDGVGCEPASAASLAGLKKLVAAKKVDRGADVVAILTGHQLKDPEIALKRRTEADLAKQRIRVDPTAAALRSALERILASTL
jgi:threonine synthase